MKSFIFILLILIAISMFCGVIIISIGFGSVITQLNYIAKPIVCGNNAMDVTQHVAHYRPGETSWSVTVYCVDNDSGAKTDVTGLTRFVAGLIYSLLPLAGLIGLWLFGWYKNPAQASPSTSVRPAKHRKTNLQESGSSESMETKLEKLKELRESNLISEEDYQKKKDEILKAL